MLYSFSTELYLKCLILENGDEPEHIHDLLKLWDKVDPRARQMIEEGDNHLCGTVPQVKQLHDNYPHLDWSIRGVLGEARNAFILWRYFYETVLEGNQKEVTFSPFEATHSIRQFILSMYPKWAEVDNDEILGERTSKH